MRRDYTQECENVGVLLNNLKFSLTMMNEVMGGILEGEAESEQVAIAWMKENPAVVDKWLAGVSTFDGKDGRAAFRNFYGF